jgi:hypothetical protein
MAVRPGVMITCVKFAFHDTSKLMPTTRVAEGAFNVVPMPRPPVLPLVPVRRGA